jgi:RiboL-PSP-HEPN
MKLQVLSSQIQRLHWLISQANELNADQLELRAHWARYICVLSAGFLENAHIDVYSQYARSCSTPAVADYVESTLRKIQNPKAKRFEETAKSFNKAWEENLTIFLGSQGRREAIDAIMSNRHLIAHGKDSGITLARLKEYLSKSVEVVEFIENQCNFNQK